MLPASSAVVECCPCALQVTRASAAASALLPIHFGHHHLRCPVANCCPVRCLVRFRSLLRLLAHAHAPRVPPLVAVPPAHSFQARRAAEEHSKCQIKGEPGSISESSTDLHALALQHLPDHLPLQMFLVAILQETFDDVAELSVFVQRLRHGPLPLLQLRAHHL